MALAHFELIPDLPDREELLDGALLRVSSPPLRTSEIGRVIRDHLLARLPSARVHFQRDFTIGSHRLRPEVAITDDDPADSSSPAPIVVVQLAWPGDMAEDFGYKTRLYFSAGAKEVWEVWSGTNSVQLWTGDRATRHHTTMFSAALGLEFDVTEWFR